MISELRHLTSINDLTDSEIDGVFRVADRILANVGDQAKDHSGRLIRPYRIAKSSDEARGLILASLFYEPSTRTRLSFESAMHRLGGSTITSADPATSSVAKGESLADTVRVIGNYADIIVLRHPKDGAARLAAEYSPIPVINGGDGSHEHPTQTLCDLYTLRRDSRKLGNLNVAISGDLKGSRTIHSFVYALARFGSNIILMPARGMELPEYVVDRLLHEFNCSVRPATDVEVASSSVDALYVTPEKPHQLSLMPTDVVDISVTVNLSKIDVVYVTRFQKERWTEAAESYPKIDSKFLKHKRFQDTRVLHPLPRVGEIDIALDSDKRAVYFQQAAYGVPIRMSLISLFLGISGQSLARFPGGFALSRLPIYQRPVDVGISCANKNCIVHDSIERQHAANKFYIVSTHKPRPHKLRCVYCETDISNFIVASEKQRSYWPVDMGRDFTEDLPRTIFFSNEEDARSYGFHSAHSAKAKQHRHRSPG